MGIARISRFIDFNVCMTNSIVVLVVSHCCCPNLALPYVESFALEIDPDSGLTGKRKNCRQYMRGEQYQVSNVLCTIK